MIQSFGLQPADLILVLLLLLNALTFVVYGVDKWHARGGTLAYSPSGRSFSWLLSVEAWGLALGMVVWEP